MRRFEIVEPLVLSFLMDVQYDILFEEGIIETDGHTVWLINDTGRHESITTANIVDFALESGVLRPWGP